MKDRKRFTLIEISTLVDLPARTIRYYIQMGLLDKPLGVGRGSHYDQYHLEKLIAIKKWSDAGLSLERISELLSVDEQTDVPPLKPRQSGEIEVWSHLHVNDGIEINIEPGRAGLSPEQVREFTRSVMALYESIKDNQEKNDDSSDAEK